MSLVHLDSHWVLASFTITQADELAHLRLRQLMEEVVALTDWTKGIKAVLHAKQGDQKQYQWEKQILGIWQQQERIALFALSEAEDVAGCR